MANTFRKAPRSRTFTGCRTCRDRHAKCDERQPVCGVCLRLGLVCDGYVPRLFWLAGSPSVTTDMQQSHRGHDYRYPLFSGMARFPPPMSSLPLGWTKILTSSIPEADRHRMSTELTLSLGNRSADDILHGLDSKCEQHGKDSGGDFLQPPLSVGPFGVFSATCASQRPSSVVSTSPSSLACTAGAKTVDSSPALAINLEEQAVGLPEHLICPDPSQLSFDTFLDFLDPALRGSQQPVADPSLAYLISGDQHLMGLYCTNPITDDQLPPSWADPDSDRADTSRIDGGEIVISTSPTAQINIPPLSTPYADDGTGILPQHAEHLLRFYRRYMSQPSPSQARRKSPWQILFIPCALQTYAELSLWNQTTHTRLTTLYALLANSAFQQRRLGGSDSSFPSWLKIGREHQENAKHHLRKALQSEITGQNQAEYTELLMAILLIAMVSVCTPIWPFAKHFIRVSTAADWLSYTMVQKTSRYSFLMPSS